MEGESRLMEIKELIQELMKKETQCNVSEVIEKLFSEIKKVTQESGNESQKAQIEESVVNLWNWTVIRKVGPTITDLQRIKLRHIACKLMMFCEVSNPPEEMMRRQILMVMKTGKGWVDAGKPTLANEFLEIAMNNLEKLYAQLTTKSRSEADIHTHKADVEKDVFKVLSYQAESAVTEGDFQKAVMCVQRCKDILMRLPKESCYLSLLCYNFGVETYELKKHEQSSFWLSQSYEIGKMNKNYSPGQEMQAKVLRLLATVYLEWDYKEYQDKAIRAITMANEENLHPAGFFLKIKILLKGCASDEDVGSAVTEFLHHKFSLDIFLDTAKLLLEHEREAIGFDFLKSVTQLFEGSPDVGKVILLHIEFLLQRMKEPLAKKMIEDLIAGHSTGKQLPPGILNHLHHVLWDRAARNYEVKRYSDALSWYKYSLSFYSSRQIDQNLAKLQRNMAACYLHLEQLEKAHESVMEAERCDPNSIFTQFYVYKLAVLEKKSQKAFDAIVVMGKSAAQLDTQLIDGTMATNLLSLAAQIALERHVMARYISFCGLSYYDKPLKMLAIDVTETLGIKTTRPQSGKPTKNDQQPVAVKALEYLSHILQDSQQALTALKCLIRLVLSKFTVKSKEEITNDMETLLTYLTAALQRLDAPIGEESKTLDTRVSEAHWFRKIAWNLAVQCENCPRTMRDFFVISFKFSQFCPPDKAVLLAQRTCLLMAAAVNLDMGRSSLLPTDQTELLNQALEHIQSCKEIWTVLKLTGDFPKDPTDTLLLLYEFESRAKLNDLSVDSLLDQVWELPEVEIKILETIASLAMESPAHYPSVCKRALKMVLTLLRKQETTDVIMFSKCLHSLVCLSLPAGMAEIDACVLEESWGYFEDALRILGNTVLQASYPQVEIVWLMTRAWNTGIYQYSIGRYKEAEQWCGLGMRFLGHLGTLKSSYESQMTGLYGEVLDKLDSTKTFLLKEE